MHEADCFCARRGDERVFPDARFGVVDESMLLKSADEITTKILHADVSVTLFRCRQIHAVKRDDSTRLYDAVEFFDKIIELFKEFFVILDVAHVVSAVAVGVERCERRRENTEADGVVR